MLTRLFRGEAPPQQQGEVRSAVPPIDPSSGVQSHAGAGSHVPVSAAHATRAGLDHGIMPPPSLQNMIMNDGEIESLIESSPESKRVSLSDFEIMRVIGQGSFGKVFQVCHRDSGAVYAMKSLRKKRIIRKRKVQHTRTERRILETDSKLYMIMDYVNGGDMFFHLQKESQFSEERSKFYTVEIILALDHLHRAGIIYRDLKAENVLLDADGHVKLADFGLAKENIQIGEQSHTYCGTVPYMPPEILRRSGHSHSVDWWCLGVLLFEMLTGLHPFFSENDDECRHNILDRDIIYPPFVNPDAKDLMSTLLRKSANQRPSVGEIKAHPFFKGVDWEAFALKKYVTPFKPSVRQGQFDSSNFDEDLTRREPVDSPVEAGGFTSVNFSDFSYQGRSQMHDVRTDRLVGMIEEEAMSDEHDGAIPIPRNKDESDDMRDEPVFPMSL